LQIENSRSRRLRADSVADAAADYLNLGVIWESLPRDSEGEIAAMIMPLQQEIIINDRFSSLKEGFGQSTIAHEIGHWILHIDRRAVGESRDKLASNSIGEAEIVNPFLCRNIASLKGMEWQAQYFASCFLMPQDLLAIAIQGRDLTNWKHLYAMADEFGVTISNLINRLTSLKLIFKEPNSKRIHLGRNTSQNIPANLDYSD
jgi:Zn-dependent peptidase ImmA (M78 family)